MIWQKPFLILKNCALNKLSSIEGHLVPLFLFVLEEQSGCEIWHNGVLLAASDKQTVEVLGDQIHLDLSAMVKNRWQNDETWMRRAEKQFAQSWRFFKKQ